ncbi:intradiol ring-cleavage dioxygenase [Leptolyngbya sp. AN02str]|uniref:intradiol ring-cleavage dioxygenase n=1 Tax=Leptolyngbya sp. AN02str TaxID=3423363 RepID=UPI003D31D65C
MNKHSINRPITRPAIRPTTAATLRRREVLRFLGGLTTVSLVGCSQGQSTSSQSTGAPTLAATTPNCVVKPEQTEGPYFVDERLNRSDIRSDPSTGLIKQGVPLQLTVQVSQVGNGTCTPLRDAMVDIWHCDAEGVYSDVSDRQANTVGQKFLRGYQTTDANGIAQFSTIYPGWYPGRTVHIHFKIRANSTAQQSYEFTSQLYFDDAVTDQVYAQPPYARGGQRTPNHQDGIFRNGGDQLMLQLAQTTAGYTATFPIGLNWT